MTGHAEVIHADVQRLLLARTRNSPFGSYIRIASQLTTEKDHQRAATGPKGLPRRKGNR